MINVDRAKAQDPRGRHVLRSPADRGRHLRKSDYITPTSKGGMSYWLYADLMAVALQSGDKQVRDAKMGNNLSDISPGWFGGHGNLIE